MEEYICPHCKNSIYDDDALLCHFCGESLQRASRGALGKLSNMGPHKLFFVAVALLALMVVLFFLL